GLPARCGEFPSGGDLTTATGPPAGSPHDRSGGISAADLSPRAGREPVRASGLGGPRGPDGRGCGTGSPDVAAGAVVVAGSGPGRLPLRTVCPGRDRAPGGVAPDVPGRASRGGPGPRPDRCPCR